MKALASSMLFFVVVAVLTAQSVRSAASFSCISKCSTMASLCAGNSARCEQSRMHRKLCDFRCEKQKYQCFSSCNSRALSSSCDMEMMLDRALDGAYIGTTRKFRQKAANNAEIAVANWRSDARLQSRKKAVTLNGRRFAPNHKIYDACVREIRVFSKGKQTYKKWLMKRGLIGMGSNSLSGRCNVVQAIGCAFAVQGAIARCGVKVGCVSPILRSTEKCYDCIYAAIGID